MQRRLVVLFVSLLSAASALMSAAQANPKYAAFVMHAETGDILFDRYSTEARYPASLTKMMTLYLLFEELEAGRKSLDDKMTVSKRASLMPASRLGMAQGSKIEIDTAIRALVIKSANDVATVVAEDIAGSESAFAQKMTQKAREMGMRRTTFRNASGLPDSRQRTTARDMAILSQRLTQDFPQYFHYFDEDTFEWNGRTYKSHNKVSMNYTGADGLKTGYTRASGYNLATTAKRGEHRLIGVVLGGRSGTTRNKHMEEILDNAFAAIEKKPTLLAAVHRVRPVPSLRPDRIPSQPIEGPVVLASLGTPADPAASVPEPAAASAMAASAKKEDTETVKAEPAVLDAGALTRLAAAETASLVDSTAPYGEGDADPSLTRDWIVQVGAFGSQPQAIAQIHATQDTVRKVWSDVGREVNIAQKEDSAVYRARFTRLTESEAMESCSNLKKGGGDCLVLQMAE